MKRITPLTPAERARLERLRALSRLLDEAFRVPGTRIRFGLDGLVGLVPVLGDITTGLFSFYIVRQAVSFGVPGRTVSRMILNVLVDVVAGSVPLAGDAMDVLWKANRKNLKLLEKWLEESRVGGSPVIDV
ncbi:MAG TPA: DUF4112 domain-containing protein [Methylomirabilota bacterium]|nr:DUF4112 domain-containing protein [Methylomirabilota bacterium]